jgi:hypothetical protein
MEMFVDNKIDYLLKHKGKDLTQKAKTSHDLFDVKDLEKANEKNTELQGRTQG